MINRRRTPGDAWNPNSKSIFAEGIPKALQIHEPTPAEASAPTTVEAATMEPAAAAAAAAKLPPLRRS
jgi:hypothetical protein